MQAYKMIVAYDGTDFNGWQIQPKDPSITACLQQTWLDLFSQPITIIGASRTDTGVHALGQVARFKADINLDNEKLRTVWNARLPNSVHIRTLTTANASFHPCANVKQKTYHYVLFLRRPLPMVARYGWLYRFVDLVDWQKFQTGLNFYVGTHDFGSFCKIEEDDRDTVRTIDSITIKSFARYGALIVTIKGKAFLRFQIRRMIGYALDVARRRDLPVDYLQDLLKHPNPQQTLLKADGCGLCLRKVVYHDDSTINQRVF